jgi:tRNA (adenine37-N6)-methyltransferase
MEIKPIAHIETDFGSKFGVPRQSGVVSGLQGRIVFEPEFRNADALRGLEDFDYVWLLWDFSEAHRQQWSPTVRPPRLGGNARVGVFATRSPFRPNNIGLSAVRLRGVDYGAADGPVLLVEGADLMNGTPIYDVKPYLAYTDAHPDARSGFTAGQAYTGGETLDVSMPPEVVASLGEAKAEALRRVVACDPRPRYGHDASRVYGFVFARHEVKFKVEGRQAEIVSCVKATV